MKRRVPLIMKVLIVLVVLGTKTTAQPTVVADVPENSTGFTEAGDLVFFTAGSALWRTDGTDAGTIQLLPSGFDQSHLWHLEGYGREFEGSFYFVNANNTQLWRSDGTPSGTVLLKTSSANNVRILGVANDFLFFVASDPTSGAELHRTDGTISGTVMLRDINPGLASGYQGVAAAVGNKLFFAADDGTSGTELWNSDGTTTGTVMVADINPGGADGFSVNTNGFSFGEKFYFNGANAEGAGPWVSDGTPAGTYMLVDAGTGGTMSVTYQVVNNGELYFVIQEASSYGTGNLWKTAGTPATTSFIASVGLDQSTNELHSFLVYDGKVYFWIRSEHVQDNLWVTDGTGAGTHTFFDLITVDGGITFFDVVNDYLVFTGDTQGIPFDLYRSDGTSEGTEIFAKIKAKAYLVFPRDITKVGDYVFYGDHEGLVEPMSGSPQASEDSYQLFEADGITSRSMRTLWGVNTTGSDNITGLNGNVLFTTSGNGVKNLWIYDPSVRPSPEPTFTLVHAGSDDDLKRLIDGTLIVNGYNEPLNIRFEPVETAGSVVFIVNGTPVRRETTAPYSLAGDVNGNYAAWSGAAPGEYTLTARSYANTTGTGTPLETLTVTFRISEDDQQPQACTASGTITREYWSGVSGNEVWRIPVNTEPTSVTELNIFEGPSNVGTNYGSRIRGYICPPVTGGYTFWISSNDNSELWLSTDDDPSNKRRIAYLERATGPREWTKFPTQVSVTIWLEQGQSYYIEALHKQGIGTDHVAVGWRLPDGTLERPISGSRLSPYMPSADATARVAATADTSEPEPSNANRILEQLSIYPNPATGGDRELTIGGYESMEEMIETKVEIVNMAGDVVFADRVSCGGDCGAYLLKVNQQLKPGLYLVNFKADGARFSKRLLVK